MIHLEQFASERGLRLKRDECRDLMIPAKLGHIYEHGAGLFGVVLSESAGHSNKILLARRRQLLKAGLKLHQAGDAESILLFDPASTAQAQAVIHAAGARKKRRQTSGQLLNLRKAPEKMPLQAVGNDAVVGDGSVGLSACLEGSVSSIPIG
jgi:hypothetical protein